MDLLKEGIKSKVISSKTEDSLKRNLFHQCCIFGNLEMLKFLCDKWGNRFLHKVDLFETSCAHFAARNNHLEILEFLEEKKFSFNVVESRFFTSPLDWAILMKHSKCISFLISKSNQTTLNSALLNSTYEGNLALSKALLANGALLDSRARDNGSTPLERAAYNGHTELVQFLLGIGANVKLSRPDKTTPLYVACQNGHSEIVKLLLSYKAEPDIFPIDTGCTPLFMAAQHGHVEIVRALLENGAQVNFLRDADHTSPLFIASQSGFKDIVELLLKHGADPNIVPIDSGCTPLFMASQNSHNGIMKLLIEHGADVNKCRRDNTSPLIITSYLGLVEEVKLLLESGADISIIYNGYTAIEWARLSKHHEIVQLIENFSKKEKKT